MCVQCAATATTATVAVGGAAGIRALLRAKAGPWMTPRMTRLATASLLAVAVVASAVTFG